jgi:hypothetical protein
VNLISKLTDILFLPFESMRISEILTISERCAGVSLAIYEPEEHTLDFTGELMGIETQLRESLFERFEELGIDQAAIQRLLSVWLPTSLRVLIVDASSRRRQAHEGQYEVLRSILGFDNLDALEFEHDLEPNPFRVQPVLAEGIVFVRDSEDQPISAGTWQWNIVRDRCITATDAMKILTGTGKDSIQAQGLVRQKVGLEETWGGMTQAMQQGLDMEPSVLSWVQQVLPNLGLLHNNYLLAKADNPRFVATPDIIAREMVGDVKVSSREFSTLVGHYWNQLQWQMLVGDVDHSILIAVHPDTNQARLGIVMRDSDRHGLLVSAANNVLNELDALWFSRHSLNAWPVDWSNSWSSVYEEEYVEDEIEDESEHPSDFDKAISWQSSQQKSVAPGKELLEVTREEIASQLQEAIPTKDQLIHTFLAYQSGKSVEVIAHELACDKGLVIQALSWLYLTDDILRPQPGPARYGFGWTEMELETIDRLLNYSVALDDLAFVLQRDEFGVAFQIFETLGIRFNDTVNSPESWPFLT